MGDALLRDIRALGPNAQRRQFLQHSFLLASASMSAAVATNGMAGENEPGTGTTDGDPDILILPRHSISLGKPMTQASYGQPSSHENTILRRASPGLTRTQESSVSFTPLQGLFRDHHAVRIE